MISEDQLARLARFDRRLRVVRVRGSWSLYNVVYEDGLGKTAVALRGVTEVGTRELRRLVLESPWRCGMTYGRWMHQFEKEEAVPTAHLERIDPDRAQRAFDKLQFYRRGKGVKFDGRRMSA